MDVDALNVDSLNIVLLQVFNGLSVGSILLLAALGLAITFGVMDVINMAHGQFIMVGGYAAYLVDGTVARYFGAPRGDLAYVLALPLSFILSAVLGILLEQLVVRFLYRRPLDTLLATFGVGLMMQQAAKDIFGAPNVTIHSPSWLEGQVVLSSGFSLPIARLFILALSGVCLGLVYLYLYRSARGRRIRAVIQNRDMAECLGVATGGVDRETFAIGTGLAGVAGAALCLIGPIGPFVGNDYIVDSFMVVITGGVGQLLGTVSSAFLMGSLDAVFNFVTDASLGKVFVFLTIIAFLQWRPRGLVNVKSR